MMSNLPPDFNFYEWLEGSPQERKNWQSKLDADPSALAEAEKLQATDSKLRDAALRQKIAKNLPLALAEKNAEDAARRNFYLKIAAAALLAALIFLLSKNISSGEEKQALPKNPILENAEPAPPAEIEKAKPAQPEIKKQHRQVAKNGFPKTQNPNDVNLRGAGSNIPTLENAPFLKANFARPDFGFLKQTRFSKIHNLLKANNLNQVLTDLENLKPASDTAYFLQAVCLLEMGKPNDAARKFSRIYSPEKPFYKETQWFLALAFASADRTDAARNLLKTIAATPGHPRAAAASKVLETL